MIELPGYLQYPVMKLGVENGALDLLEGSRVRFEGKASRTLAGATAQAGDQNLQTLSIQGERFQTESLELEGISDVAFSWRDQLGLAGAPWLI